MEILPAIDLRGGKVVRLSQGDYDRQTVYADDPAAVVASYVAAGARWIHTVDLDAARTGRRANNRAVEAICRAAGDAGVEVQCGGGVRDRSAIEALRAAGVSRMVIGSAAVKDWAWFEALLADDGLDSSLFALGLDAREGHVAAEGWTEQLSAEAVVLARRVSGSGLGAIVYTDISRDGMLTGTNLDATAAMVSATDVPVIASGGVASTEDVRGCMRIGCAGVIIGRALYEGRLDLAEACRMALE